MARHTFYMKWHIDLGGRYLILLCQIVLVDTPLVKQSAIDHHQSFKNANSFSVLINFLQWIDLEWNVSLGSDSPYRDASMRLIFYGLETWPMYVHVFWLFPFQVVKPWMINECLTKYNLELFWFTIKNVIVMGYWLKSFLWWSSIWSEMH